ncbi:MAG: flagellar hook-associated protein FlgK [Chloroflexi bacterium]|nr:flagellar hook-associated protein FlgK [Chloroflexota bacterium]
MPTLFSGLNLALRALLSHQQAIQVTEHNVANAATPGYRRQEAVLAAGPPYAPPTLQRGTLAGQMGSGVVVERVRRFSLEFFDGRYRREIADTQRWEVERDALRQVESTLGETTGDGLLPKLDAFWAGWQALSADPASTALRADLRERARSLADALNRRAGALNALRADQDLSLVQRVDEANTLASQVARLNAEVMRVQSVGDQPNDLLDERDRAMDRLAELSGAVAYVEPSGAMLVSIEGHALVVGDTALQLATSPNPANGNLARIAWADGQAFNAARGEIAGLLDARDRVIPDQLAGLNATAYNLATRVNALHQAGFGPPPANATGLEFFTAFTTTDYALEISVSANIDNLANIATAAAADSPGDGSAALAIANVQSELLMNGGTATLNQYYTGGVGTLGLEVKTATAAAADRQLVADALSQQRESVSGVSLDEEATHLLQSQRAYEAAARLMTAVDEMVDRVINGMGRVGL